MKVTLTIEDIMKKFGADEVKIKARSESQSTDGHFKEVEIFSRNREYDKFTYIGINMRGIDRE